MPLSDPEGEISTAEDLLADTIAASERFQALVGAADATEAKQRIHFDALPSPAAGSSHSLDELEEHRPYALIYTDEETGIRWEFDASPNSHRVARHVLKFWIERNVPHEIANDPSEVDRTFKNDVGVIVNEILAVAVANPYMVFNALTMTGPMRSREEDSVAMGDYQQAQFVVEWGIGG